MRLVYAHLFPVKQGDFRNWMRKVVFVYHFRFSHQIIQNMKKVLVYWWTVKSWVNGPMTPVRPTGWIFYTRAIMIFSDCTMDRPQNKPQNCIYFLKPKGFGVEKSIGFWRIAVEIVEFWEVKRLWSIAVDFKLGSIHKSFQKSMNWFMNSIHWIVN